MAKFDEEENFLRIARELKSVESKFEKLRLQGDCIRAIKIYVPSLIKLNLPFLSLGQWGTQPSVRPHATKATSPQLAKLATNIPRNPSGHCTPSARGH